MINIKHSYVIFYQVIFAPKFDLCWFQFSKGPLMDGLYWETWYNDRNVSQDELGYIFYENKLLGVPRIRQLKVKNDSCTIHDDFKDQISTCYDSYAEAIEENRPFGLMNGTA